MKTRFMWPLFVALLLPCTLWAHSNLDQREATRRASNPWPEPPPVMALKISALGYSHFAADMMWLAAIQYYGAERNRSDGHFRLLIPFLQRVTALDPKFEYAYRFGGISAVGEDGANLKAANELLLAGEKALPDVWRIPYIRASNCLQHGADRACMASGFAAAAKAPGSPEWLGLLASRHLEGEEGEAAAFDLLARLVENTQDEMLKLRVEARLAELKIGVDLAALDSALERYRQRLDQPKACPLDWSELLDDILIQVPISPGGMPYEKNTNCEPEPAGFGERKP
jgi:hypothetical protein